MNGFRPTAHGVTARFDATDAALLADLATQLAVLIAERADFADRAGAGEDPVLARLLPDAYRDSPEDAAEFRRFTESELGDEKVRAALELAEALEPAPGTKTVTVMLDRLQSVSWLRSLTDIRLALATRIGIDDSGQPTIEVSHSEAETAPDGSSSTSTASPASPTAGSASQQTELTFALYQWLSALQESLVHAVDR